MKSSFQVIGVEINPFSVKKKELISTGVGGGELTAFSNVSMYFGLM